MSKQYKKYIKPVIKNLSMDAYNELKADKTANEYLLMLRLPEFLFKSMHNSEVMVNYLYWFLVDLYSQTHFVNQKLSDDLCKFQLVVEPGQQEDVRQAFNYVSHIPLMPVDNRLANFEYLGMVTTLRKNTVKKFR